MERELRFPSLHHPLAPDVVRSTIGQSIRINDKTIDRLFCAPDKIVIPERYVPEQQVEEIGEEEKQKRIRKTESIRRMLTGSASVQLPRPPSGDFPFLSLDYYYYYYCYFYFYYSFLIRYLLLNSPIIYFSFIIYY